MAALAVTSVGGLWPSFDLTNLRGNLPAFKAAVAQEVRGHAQAASSLALQQYQRQRAAAGVTRAFRPKVADAPPVSQVDSTVDWATQPLWDTAIPAATVPGAPAETQQAASTAIADAKARLADAAERHVLDTGARTITENAMRDPQARGYARIPEGGACSFCLMLALRGAVFKADRSGGRGDSFAASNAKFTGSGTIKVHDHCRCHAEPVFGIYEAPASVRAAQALYKTHVTDAGRTGADARAAFRQAVEGRDVVGLPEGTKRKAKTATGASKPAPKLGERSPAQVQAELNGLAERLAGTDLTDQQRTWLTDRVSTLRGQLTPT